MRDWHSLGRYFPFLFLSLVLWPGSTFAGTGSGNNGDEIEQVYEKAASLLNDKIYPEVIPCLARRTLDPLAVAEAQVTAVSLEILQELKLLWNSQWPAAHQQGGQCFVTTEVQTDPVFLSWDECKVAGQAVEKATENLLQIVMLKRQVGRQDASRWSAAITAAIKSGKCGYVF